MKLCFYFCIIALTIFPNKAFGQNNLENSPEFTNNMYFPDSIHWEIETLDTGRDSSFMTEMEKNVILEINMLRSNPALYAKLYLTPRLSKFYGNLYDNGEEIKLMTNEGQAAVTECINILTKLKPSTLLLADKELHKMAKYMAKSQGKTVETGHNTPTGQTFTDRIKLFKIASKNAAENISYGYFNAREIVIQLIIDDGVISRGHRKNIFGAFTKVGISIEPHKKYNYMCVQDFSL